MGAHVVSMRSPVKWAPCTWMCALETSAWAAHGSAGSEMLADTSASCRAIPNAQQNKSWSRCCTAVLIANPPARSTNCIALGALATVCFGAAIAHLLPPSPLFDGILRWHAPHSGRKCPCATTSLRGPSHRSGPTRTPRSCTTSLRCSQQKRCGATVNYGRMGSRSIWPGRCCHQEGSRMRGERAWWH